MKITLHGAGGGEVTGSAYQVQTREADILVDFGLFQGARKVENYNCLPKKGMGKRLDAVVLIYCVGLIRSPRRARMSSLPTAKSGPENRSAS